MTRSPERSDTGSDSSTGRHLPALILASGSPRRRVMLRELGLEYSVRPVDVDESVVHGEDPTAYVRRLAHEKATARFASGELILAADTIVLLDDTLLGKPRTPEEAARMLRTLSGREHTVLSGVALFDPERDRVAIGSDSTQVGMAEMTDEEIGWYVATGEPLDKAGSYAIQGLGTLLVNEIQGNYTNVVGLPLPTMRRLFTELGYDLREFRIHPPEDPT